jgi:hypothetical protein
MPANTQRGLLKVATELQAQGSIDREGLAGGLTSVARGFAQIGNDVGRIADHAAAVEGAEAGRLAGLDPEFRPTKSMTIRGEAYDQAGIAIYGTRAKERFAADLADAYDKHQADPQALGAALDAKRNSWIGEALPEIRPELELQFEKSRFTYMRQAARAQAARVSAEQTAALQSELGLQLKTLDQRAYALGLDDKADEVLASDIGELTRTLSRRGADGKPLVDPGRTRQILDGTKEQVATARLLGAFERTQGLEAKQAFIDKFREDFAKSEGLAKTYDFEGFKKVERALEADLTRAASQRSAELRVLQGAVKSQSELAKKGFSPPPDELAALKARVAASGSPELAAGLAQAENLLQWQSAARVMPPSQLDQLITAERQRLSKGGATPFETERLALADSLLGNMHTELAKDPLGWADRVGLLPVTPLNFSDEVEVAASLRTRIAEAEQVASYYGQAPQYLRPDEKRALTTLMNEGGAQMLGIADAVAGAAEDRTPAILGELADEAPALAMLAGLNNAAGRTIAARDAADGLAITKSEEGKKLIAGLMPKASELRSSTANVIGDALADMPRSEGAAITLANQIYAPRALRQGKTAFDAALWEQALREALGEHVVNGETYGGIVENDFSSWRSERKIVLPPNVRQGSWRQVIDMITPADLAAADLGNPVGEDGKTVPLERLKNMRLIQMPGVGRYAVAADDGAMPGEERFVYKNRPGDPFVIDLGKLAPRLARRRPDLFLGGGGGS